jgi:hypothetical protein
MSVSVFDSKLVLPNEKMLATELGKTKEHFNLIASFIRNEGGDLRLEWKFYGEKSGWLLKMLCKKRNMMFVVPGKDHFKVSFIFGEKAVGEIMASDLPDFIKQLISGSKKYPEGRGIQLEIKTRKDCEQILNLIRIKLSH